MKRFDISDVRRMATDITYARGLKYFEAGRVLSVSSDEGANSLFAEVRGSAYNVYRVTLSGDAGMLFSNCTCPVGFNCKHGVATALTLVHQNAARGTKQQSSDPAASNSWQQWLAELPPDASSQVPSLPYGRQYLRYHLVVGKGRVELEVNKGYLKKDGQWSQINRFSPDTVYSEWNRPSYITDDDQKILQLLPGRTTFEPIVLRGERGQLTLTSLLACRRLFFDNQVVTQAKPRNLDWQWQDVEGDNAHDNAQQLIPRLGPGGEHGTDWALFDTLPPWYLDTATATVGPVVSPLHGPRIQHLLSMPPVHKNELAKMSAELRQRLPQEHFPLPLEPEVTTVTEFTPHLTLILFQLDGLRLPGVALHFDYEGFHVAPTYAQGAGETLDPAKIQERDGLYYQINRDLDQERACCDLLHELGLYLEWPHSANEEPAWLPDADSLSNYLSQWSHIEEHEIPQLKQQGWRVETADDFQFQVSPAEFEVELIDAPDSWFDFSLALPLGNGKQLDTVEVVETWLQQGAPEKLMLNVDGQWVSVDTRPLQSVRSLIQDLFSQDKLRQPARLPAFQLGQLDAFSDLNFRRSPATKKLMEALKNFSGLKTVKPPAGLNAQLRDYQQTGLNWLCFLQQYGFGGILADDMGLGKTLQALALVAQMKQSHNLKAPALVVVPTSLTGNWLQEAARFAPRLRVTLIHGPDRATSFDQIDSSDLVITTYPLLLRDLRIYRKQPFSLLILDEAQAIKNPRTKISESVRQIQADCRVCMTGTPLENHLGELWALMDFCLPGLLGGQKTFNQWYRTPIEKQGNTQLREELARKVSPFMVRRTKGEVAQELPPKTEIVQYVELSGKQRALYESIRISMEKRIRDLVASQGMARSHIQFLDALLKLRQACIDPRLVKLPAAAQVRESAKLEWLDDTLPQLLEEGRRILLFSQFTQALKLVEEQLNAAGIGYAKLTGQTRKRQEAIDSFQNGEVRVFLISLKAGGSGLNLTAADVVIHIDPWWNPAVENQATDRAHRIGQDKPVFVYKLVAAGTVEERINQMQQDKQALADALFDATQSAGLPRSGDDLLALLSE